MTNIGGLIASVQLGDTTPRFANLLFNKTIRIGDTKYHIQCTYVIWVKNDTLSKMLQQHIIPNGNPH